MAKDYRRTKQYRDLKTSLEESLKERGLLNPEEEKPTDKVFQDLLNRYMDLWCEYQELSADIAERGVVVMDGKRGMLVENRSLTIRHQTSNKMLDIYAALGFRDISAPRAGVKTGGADPNDEL